MYRVTIFLIIMLSLSGTANAGVQGTKHDLSFQSGPGPIKSTNLGTSEVCVFCHTPHTAATDIANAPLWNKDIFKNPDPSYTVYTSDVLSQLSYPAAEQPIKTGKAVHLRNTRLCLSCHDGTIALGSLKNLPYGLSGDIPMAGGVTTMPTSAAGYIGVELQDDHPVAIPYASGGASGQDPELRVSPSAPIRLFNDSGIDYVECTSCHDAHNNQFGNFLLASNTNSAICVNCHNKTGFTGSIHDVSTLSYSPPDGTGSGFLGTTVGEVKCMNCHFPHKAGVTAASPTTPNPTYGKYLLSFQEEASCFNNPNDRWNTAGASGACHGNMASGLNATRRNIESLISETSGKQYKHRVADSLKAGKHKATEGQAKGWLGSGNAEWHVECADCHNLHTSGSGVRSIGVNTVSSTSSLYGAGGVSVVGWPTFALPSTGSYSYIQPIGTVNTTSPGVTKEYEICLKCHSDFAWGTATPPTSPSLGLSMTNQAVEFNPANASFHPVAAPNPNTEGTYTGGWTNGIQTMYCSDCHGNNTAPASGPHGSSVRSILTNTYDPATVGSVSSEICFKCHDYATYFSGGVPITNTGFRDATRNLHYEHMNPNGAFVYQGGATKTCTRCHINPIHGSSRPHLLSYVTDPAPYGTYSMITNHTPTSPGSYTGASCSTQTCHAGAQHGPG